MAKSEVQGLSGRIEVSSSWKESGNGHVEITSSIELQTDDGKVILREQNCHQNSLKSDLSRRTTKCYEIEIRKLLALIKEHEEISNKYKSSFLIHQGANIEIHPHRRHPPRQHVIRPCCLRPGKQFCPLRGRIRFD